MKKDIITEAFDAIPPENKQFVSKNLDISQQVFAILKEKDWTQKDLAKKLGKYDSDVSRMLSGLHNLTLKTITNLEVILGADIIITPAKAKEEFGKIKYVSFKVEVRKNERSNTSTLNDVRGAWGDGVHSFKNKIA